ncbi:hypothetical protein R6V09_19790 [Streptomyces sp. W16]|uniref:hypothetical protein n=1 Tax=Streptomyces sp. W16 TaxID=3076631 RepID=UPI00295A6F0F|nr:hypothetical protein [Streptomyces sp. W16]MDV9172333.1 hypothetical protein [Streptomyces sp. W16]
MTDDIALRLDRDTAEDLYEVLWLMGEHIAAGAPIPEPPAEAEARLAQLFKSLGDSLGKGRRE